MADPASDEQLMARTGEGDMDAFQELVERHQRYALSIAYRFLGHREGAEDAAQEAFLRVLSAARRYRPTAAFRTYLTNIIWHLCVDAFRERRPASLEAHPGQPDSSAGPAETVLQAERAALVRRALDQLPPRQRMVLILKHFEGMSYEEIGRTIECTPSAVDALLSRGRAKLKEALSGLL